MKNRLTVMLGIQDCVDGCSFRCLLHRILHEDEVNRYAAKRMANWRNCRWNRKRKLSQAVFMDLSREDDSYELPPHALN